MSVLFMKIFLDGCLTLIAWMPWTNLVNACPYLHSTSSSDITLILQLRPLGPGNVQSWVVLRLIIRSFFALIVHWVATPRGVTHACGMDFIQFGSIGIAHLYLTSLEKAFSRASAFSCGDDADLWFPRSMW